MGMILVVVERKIGAREEAAWNYELVIKTGIKQGTKGETRIGLAR